MKKLVKESLYENSSNEYTEDDLLNDLENINGIDDVDIEEGQAFGRGGYNVDWTDREGRHPYAEFELKINLADLSYEVRGECSTEDGRHDEESSRNGAVMNISDLAEAIDSDISDICHEIDA